MQISKVYPPDLFLDFFCYVIYAQLVNPEEVIYFQISLVKTLRLK